MHISFGSKCDEGQRNPSYYMHPEYRELTARRKTYCYNGRFFTSSQEDQINFWIVKEEFETGLDSVTERSRRGEKEKVYVYHVILLCL
jgi:hypothetical protein